MVSGFEAAIFCHVVMLKATYPKKKKQQTERSMYQHELFLVEARIYFSCG